MAYALLDCLKLANAWCPACPEMFACSQMSFVKASNVSMSGSAKCIAHYGTREVAHGTLWVGCCCCAGEPPVAPVPVRTLFSSDCTPLMACRVRCRLPCTAPLSASSACKVACATRANHAVVRHIAQGQRAWKRHSDASGLA